MKVLALIPKVNDDINTLIAKFCFKTHPLAEIMKAVIKGKLDFYHECGNKFDDDEWCIYFAECIFDEYQMESIWRCRACRDQLVTEEREWVHQTSWLCRSCYVDVSWGIAPEVSDEEELTP